ncbi:MAG: contact-dependent growth inhibition system immunity protein [Pseudonocardiaceae bacterium]
MTDDRSLEDLEESFWGPAPAEATQLVRKVYELRRKPVADLTAGEIRILVNQGVGLGILLQRAVGFLREAPLLEADVYPGDLLAAVLRIPRPYWAMNPTLLSTVEAILESIEEPPPEALDGIRIFRHEIGDLPGCAVPRELDSRDVHPTRKWS